MNIKKCLLIIMCTVMTGVILGGCVTKPAPSAVTVDKGTLVIMSGSENQTLEPIVQQFATDNNVKIKMNYEGSLDIMNNLKDNQTPFDAVWPANTIWISMGDTTHKVKDIKSIMTSPVVFGIKDSLADKLGFKNTKVSIEDIAKAVNDKKLTFMMTSATQSNSGASAYMGFIYALLGNPDTITNADLAKPALQTSIKNLFAGEDMSSGSSDWLKTAFLQKGGDCMVNYESLIIETNKQLVKEGKEPLYVVYPYDGLSIADSPLGYVDKGDAKKEATFNKLQAYLLSGLIQKKILALGRRTGFGTTIQSVDKSVFNPAWGIDTTKTLSPIRFPQEDVILNALNLYQTTLKKPSYTVFAIDYSGSMSTNGGSDGVKAAMKILLDQVEAKKYMLQMNPLDKVVVIPFNNTVIATWTADGNNPQQLQTLLNNIDKLDANGGTDIYTPVARGLEDLYNEDLSSYNPAIVLMTDGQSNSGTTLNTISGIMKNKNIPIFTMGFGDADVAECTAIANLSVGKYFDAKQNLVATFKEVKGYN